MSRPDPTVEIAFIRRSLWTGSGRGSANTPASAGAVTRHLGVTAMPLVTKITPAEQPVSETLPVVSANQVRVQFCSTPINSNRSEDM